MTMASYKFEWMHGTITAMFFSHRTSKYPPWSVETVLAGGHILLPVPTTARLSHSSLTVWQCSSGMYYLPIFCVRYRYLPGVVWQTVWQSVVLAAYETQPHQQPPHYSLTAAGVPPTDEMLTVPYCLTVRAQQPDTSQLALLICSILTSWPFPH